MKVLQVLEFARDVLVRFVSDLDDGNCIVTAFAIPIDQKGRIYAQVFYGGSSFQNWEGANLDRVLTLGVRIYNHLAIDAPSQYERQASELLTVARECSNALHNRYDTAQVPLQEPIHILSETAMRNEPEKPTLFYIEQSYSVRHIHTFDQVRGDD